MVSEFPDVFAQIMFRVLKEEVVHLAAVVPGFEADVSKARVGGEHVNNLVLEECADVVRLTSSESELVLDPVSLVMQFERPVEPTCFPRAVPGLVLDRVFERLVWLFEFPGQPRQRFAALLAPAELSCRVVLEVLGISIPRS